MKKTVSENYWENLAKKTKKKAISSTDPNLDWLERSFIEKYLKKNMEVLDVGSGDGLATLEFAQKVKTIEGLEPSLSVLKIAQNNQKRLKNLTTLWREGSALDLVKIYKNKKFDCIISKRCLINLGSWQKQSQVISNIGKLLKKGSLFLLAEGFTDTFQNLNDLRARNGLERDTVVSFNLYFERKKFENLLKKDFVILEQNNFGLYYFLSHFFYPYLIKPQNPQYRSKINRQAAALALKEKMLEEYGYISFYALKKK